MSQPLVLITGVTGFLAQHVVAATLNAGFRVRGTIRSPSKANGLLEKFPKNFETAVVEDIATSDLTDVIKGVTYVLHTASPYTFASITNGEEQLLKPAINGTLNVLRAAKKAGVKKVVITSSFAAMLNEPAGGAWRDYEYTENDWYPSTYEEAAREGAEPGMVYSAGKKLAELAAWDFAKENNMALVVLNPPMIYGPALQDAATSPASLNTSASMIYQLFSGELSAVPDDRYPLFVDVRDVAKAHVLALQKDSASGARIPLCGGGFTWAQAVEELNATRPELRSRLVPQGTGNAARSTMATISTRVAAETLGLKEFIGWKQSLSDTVDSLLELEKKWNAAA
ncbi:NAD(P)-binding protein [Athelia psychrophila]|uniref:NAD(P)-binding protein n=1 Tax=Athelia psychrophila TaxID=1759441 RepID=A0A166HXK5_9AGAM|nr:NAD(P)-binding protein [Fibularhizoctonia sp. CBS 109695]